MSDYTRHWTRRLIYTATVQAHAEEHGAFWLIDLVASWQTDPKARAEHFQTWQLVVNPDKSAVATMTDGNSKTPIISQAIEFTDYPPPGVTLYLVADGDEWVLMLPEDY